MKVDKHISELLYLHDCVIVPSLGGFVANYTSAKIHPTQHTFTPPSKNIVFNKNLSINDGLLANGISRVEKISYPEAMDTISQFVSSTNAKLKKGEKVNIENVGTLNLDVERNVQFTPASTNYQLDSFGLPDFQSPAIKRDNIGTRIEKEFKDRGAIPLVKKQINFKRITAFAILIPFILGMIWIPLKTDLLSNINYSNINPFASNKVATTETVTRAEEATIETEAIVIKTIEPTVVSDTAQNISAITPVVLEPVTEIEEVNTEKISEDVKAVTTSVAPTEAISLSDLKFHLVTGCFSIESNAINFVTDLMDDNLEASIIGKRNGLYVVSCGNFSTRKEALKNLSQLKLHQPNAWLLKK